MNKGTLLASVFGVISILVLIFSCFQTIEPGERGVLVDMGRVSPVLLKEGVVFRNIFSQRIEEFIVRQTTNSLTTSMQTKDLQTVEIDASVAYRVLDSGVIPIYKNYSGDVWGALILPRTKEAIKSAASHLTVSDFIQNRDKVKAYVVSTVNKSLSGLVEIEQLNLNDVKLSETLTHAIEEKQRMLEEAKASEYGLVKSQNEAKAMRIKADAMKGGTAIAQLEWIKKWDGHLPEVLSESAYARVKQGK